MWTLLCGQDLPAHKLALQLLMPLLLYCCRGGGRTCVSAARRAAPEVGQPDVDAVLLAGPSALCHCHCLLMPVMHTFAGEEGAQVYRRLTDLHLKLDSRTDAAASWVEASRAYAKAGNSTGKRFSQLASCALSVIVWRPVRCLELSGSLVSVGRGVPGLHQRRQQHRRAHSSTAVENVCPECRKEWTTYRVEASRIDTKAVET